MERSSSKLEKWYAILGGAFSLVVLGWLLATPSLSDHYVFLTFTLQRLGMIGLVFLCLIIFLVLFLLYNNQKTLSLFFRFIGSKWVFLSAAAFAAVFIVVISAVLLKFAGKWTTLLERVMPLLVLALLISVETLLFQEIFSRGKIRLPGLLGKFQPILEQENPDGSPLKKRLMLYIVLVLLPILLTFILVGLQGLRLINFHPAEIDEIVYQQEIATFKDHGFQGGYFSIDELVSKAGFTPFGAHGPVYAVFYGSLGKIFGWQVSSAPFYNLAVISLALIAFLWLTRPDRKQTFFLILLLGLFWPFLYYIPSVMQESLHYALAILIAGFLIRFSKDAHPPFGLKIFATAVLIFASTLRLTWVIAAFPIFILFSAKRTRKSIVISIIAAVLFSLAMASLYSWWVSAYQVGFLYQLMQQTTFPDFFNLLARHLSENIGLYFRSREITKLEIFFHYQYLAVLVLYLITRRGKTGLAKSNLFILSVAFLLTLLFYDIYDLRDLRSLAPFLLAGVLSLAFFSYRGLFRILLSVYLPACLLSAGFFYQLYSESVASHLSTNDYPMEKSFADTIENLQWKRGEPRWCNSLLAGYPMYNEVRLLPPGIGLNLMLTEPQEINVRSHYVFVAKDIYEINESLTSCKALVEDAERVFCVRVDDGCK